MKKKKTNAKRGGQPGNRNAVKHGSYTREKRIEKAEELSFLRSARRVLSVIAYDSYSG